MDPLNTSSDHEFESTNGRSVIPRRLPPVPNLPSLRVLASSPASSSSSSSPPSTTFSSSPSSAGSSSPASSPGSASSKSSGSGPFSRMRPLPQIPASRHVSNPSQSQPRPGPDVQRVVCRSCLNCVTTSESLLPPSAVPPGSRAFRGFSGKASLFTEVYNVSMSAARVQLMTTGAHTMQETFCAHCSLCLGWKIVKAHEGTERWKEGNWLLELESLWLVRRGDILGSSFGKAVEWEAQARKEVGKEQDSNFGVTPGEYPRDAMRMVRTAREKGLGLEFPGPGTKAKIVTGKAYPQAAGRHQHSRSTPNFSGMGGYRGSGSAIHLHMTCAS